MWSRGLQRSVLRQRLRKGTEVRKAGRGEGFVGGPADRAGGIHQQKVGGLGLIRAVACDPLPFVLLIKERQKVWLQDVRNLFANGA